MGLDGLFVGALDGLVCPLLLGAAAELPPTFDEALEFAAEIGAERTYLTHISHKLGLHLDVAQILPAGVFMAYDGLELNL